MTLPRKILQYIGGLYDVGILFIFQNFQSVTLGNTSTTKTELDI
jgi:hypothetical protein